MLKTLVKVLQATGKPTEVLTGGEGFRILVLPHGGRILGLFPAGSDDNFLWTNPRIHQVDSARKFFKSDEWCNTGGDRAWLAPEVEFFLPKFPDPKVYYQPRQLDPGRYRCSRVAAGISGAASSAPTKGRSSSSRAGAGLRLENRLVLRSYRTGEELALKIVKQVAPIENPFHHEKNQRDLAGVQFAGYSLRSALELSGRAPRSAVGLWHLLQLPHRGQMLIPTYSRSEPKVYFGAIPKNDLAVEDGLIRYTMRNPGEQKIGVRAIATTGRVGYVYQSGAAWSLVVRNFSVDPSSVYLDVPGDDYKDLGYAVQACNVCSATLGHFSELEYHLPGIGGPGGARRAEDVSQVWAFRGAQREIGRLIGRLLGTTLKR